MKFNPPYKVPYQVSQKFAQNWNSYYAEGGLVGHTGWDMVAPHLSQIYAVSDGYCYAHINKDNPDLMRYRAVYTIVGASGRYYEVSYGHLIDIKSTPKTYVKAGDVIGTQGNTGDVAVGGKKVTLEEKKNGSGKGSHLHFQVRYIEPKDKREFGKIYLMDDKGYVKYLDKYWEVTYYKNGFNGCIDPAPFFEGEKPDLPDKNIELQKKFNTSPEAIEAIKAFQTKKGLMADGVLGPMTQKALMQ